MDKREVAVERDGGVELGDGGGAPQRMPDRRAEIIAAAAQLFHRQGYDGTSTQDIAEAVGMLKGSLYHHIRSKADLLFAILEEIHVALRINGERSEKHEGTPLEQVRFFMGGHMDVMFDKLVWMRVYNQDLGSLDAERQAALIEERDSYERCFRNLLVAAQSAGEIRDDIDPKLLAIAVLTALNSLHRWFHPGGALDEEAIKEGYLTILLHGMVDRQTSQPSHDGHSPRPDP